LEPPVSDASETPPPPHQALALDKHTRALALYSGLRHDAENGNAGAFGALSHFANDGDSTAQLELGRLYDNRKNMLLANYWYRKSANQGDPHAQIALGFNYLLGHGVSVDPVESYKWFYLAARNVYSSTDELTLARTQLKVIELTRALTPAQIVLAESKAMQWLKAHHTR
jgi:TPR repeat protein